jgi:hypothetical protein
MLRLRQVVKMPSDKELSKKSDEHKVLLAQKYVDLLMKKTGFQEEISEVNTYIHVGNLNNLHYGCILAVTFFTSDSINKVFTHSHRLVCLMRLHLWCLSPLQRCPTPVAPPPGHRERPLRGLLPRREGGHAPGLYWYSPRSVYQRCKRSPTLRRELHGDSLYTTVNREYFVSKIFRVINFRVK